MISLFLLLFDLFFSYKVEKSGILAFFGLLILTKNKWYVIVSGLVEKTSENGLFFS